MPSPGEDVQAWSKTAATNATSDPLINWAEGQPRASVNNSARSMLAAHAKDRDLKNGSITTGGTANAQTFTSGVAYTTVPTGLTVRLKVGVTNTGATTLNMDGIGAVAIKNQAGLDIGANAMLLGRYADLLYNGTNWILLATGAESAAFDAYAFNGIQINGSMEVSQERGLGGVLLPPATAAYAIDNFLAVNLGATRSGSAGQAVIASIAGFPRALYLTCATPAALGPNDAQTLTHTIEGYRWARLMFGTTGASPVTIAFWVNATVAGTMAVSVRNGGSTNRSYIVNVTINTANIWEFKTVTVPGDTTGTWAIDNTIGGHVTFCFGGGNAFQGAPNTWIAGNLFATSSTTNFWAATNTVYITGLVILPGSEAPSTARLPFIMRPYDQELQLCRRYYQIANFDNGVVFATGQAFNSTLVSAPLYELVPVMRAAPTMGYTGGGVWYGYTALASPSQALTFNVTGRYDRVWLSTSTFLGTFNAGDAVLLFSNTNGSAIVADARL